MARSQRHKFANQGVDSSGRRAPVNTAVPTRAGTATVGQVQTGTNGTFTGGTIVITREWWRNGVPIPGQTAATYTTVAADQGKQLRFVNRARNQYGETVAQSTPVTIA